MFLSFFLKVIYMLHFPGLPSRGGYWQCRGRFTRSLSAEVGFKTPIMLCSKDPTNDQKVFFSK